MLTLGPLIFCSFRSNNCLLFNTFSYKTDSYNLSISIFNLIFFSFFHSYF
ncbi:unnamed protein product [Schistosoma mattheei]|uniref:Uncharacterized protein n=1 Tax=Schistosoma mattheei TaxID=31246 RepID=A0A3P8FSH6_9TREM|nr:unnamed protein product [Schistosoma mattheei]